MKLNKSERHTAYIIMLWEIENNFYESCEDRGFCWLILSLFDLHVYDKPVFRQQFPELYKKRPVGDYSNWFSTDAPGWQKRIKLLKQGIKETY